MTAEHDVIVVGAGFAGVAAAREIASAGRRVLVLEARDRVGGRAWYKADALAGRSLEMGGAYVDTVHTRVSAETRRYGFSVSERYGFALPTVWLLGGRLVPGPLPLAGDDVAGLEHVVVALRAAASRIDPEAPPAEQDLADLDVSFEDLVGALPLSPAAREVASAALGTIFGLESSALNLLRRIASVGSIAGYLSSTGGQTIEGGTSALARAMLDDAGADVLLSSPVRRVEQDAAGVTVSTGSQAFRARAAVVALPLNVLAHVEFDPPLAPGKRAVAEESHAGSHVKLWAVVRGAPPGFSAAGLAPELDYLYAVDTVDDGVLMVGFGADASRLDCTDRDAVERAVRRYVPAAEVVASTGHDWTADPYALGAWCAFRPGQITRYDADLRRREGRLVFAGSDTAVRWPGNIEGAVETGFRAAGEIAGLL